jgi:hypothetical protein
MKPPLDIDGLHGLGDCIHQRGVLRELIPHYDIQLSTSWPSVYHDFVGPEFKVIRGKTHLSSQNINQTREEKLFGDYVNRMIVYRAGQRQFTFGYNATSAQRFGSPLAAFCANAGIDYGPHIDFRLPVPDLWRLKAALMLPDHNKPLMLYRPLVDRPKEWGGNTARNPIYDAYRDLFLSIRDSFFVVSVAYLKPNVEWIVGHPMTCDYHFDRGELDFPAIAGLFQIADMVFTAPGFAIPLAQAVGTPVVGVFGGYENSQSFAPGSRFAPYLGIDPINPCNCFSHHHGCRKQINLPKAKERLAEFCLRFRS